MCLPADMRACILRTSLDAVSVEMRGAGLTPALAARLDFAVEEARRHARELEDALRPIPTASAPSRPSPRPQRRFTGHAEVGSNVIELRPV